MSVNIIVSYDGTYNEDDAVALGGVFAHAGASVSLAYVRHAPEPESSQERLAQNEAEALLERGAELLASAGVDPAQVGRHVVTDRSTPEGLATLAAQIGAQAIVFCSDSHTAPGHVGIGNSAQRLLDGGSTAVAIAPTGLATAGVVSVARISVAGDDSAHATAQALASGLGAEVSTATDEPADLLVVGSRPEAEQGRVSISAASENLIENATSPVLVAPRGVVVAFGQTAALSA